MVLCGPISQPQELAALGVVRLNGFEQTEWGIPVSKFIILHKNHLHKNDLQWKMELIGDQKAIRNPAGYVGIDSIDDSDDLSRLSN